MRSTPVTLVQLTFEKWYDDNVPRHAAALAYYTMFAVAPLLIIVVGIAGAFYGREAAQGKIAAQVEHYINSPPAAELLQSMLVSLNQSSSNLTITLLSVLALLYGASNVFGELQITLNLIWHAPPPTGNNLRRILIQRLLAIGMVLICGILLFLSLVLTTWIAAANRWAELHFARFAPYGEWNYFLLLLGLTTLIFTLIYRFVPDVRKPWHDVLVGAIATALLFSIARLLLGWYLGHSSLASTYGAAGSLAILLLWVYYSAQIFFLGAEFTQVYGQLYREPILPAEQAEPPIATAAAPLPTPILEPTPATLEATMPPVVPREPEKPQVDPTSFPDPVPAAVPEEPPRPPRWRRLHAAWQFLKRVRTVPRRVTRPVGEIALAAGVIGVASVAALLWSPLRHRTDKPAESPEKLSSAG